MIDAPNDEDFFLTDAERGLPPSARARLVSEHYACTLIHVGERDVEIDIGATVERVAHTIRYLVRAARSGGRRWDRAWARARREVGPLVDHELTDGEKSLYYLLARGQV